MERRKFLVLSVALLSGHVSTYAQPVTVRDGAGLPVTLQHPARRIASLVSSSIDIIVSLGAADRIVARTRYDTAKAVATAANVGGGIDPSAEVLIASRPDLFLAWRGQATTPAVTRMRALGVPVYLVETKDTVALFASVRDLGTLLGISPRANEAAEALRREFHATQATAAVRGTRPTAVYLISQSPVIIAAAGSYMAQLIGVAGADNPFRDVRGEFPTLALEAFVVRDPDIIIMGKRPDGSSQLTALRNTAGWRDLRAVKRSAVIEVNGEQWSRPTLALGALVRDLSRRLQQLAPPVRR